MSPTIVIVPGSWHTPIAFNSLIAKLSSFFPALCVSLPSTTDERPERITLCDDIDYLRNEVLLPLINGGTKLVLVMHSYGAVPGSAAVRNLSAEHMRWQGGQAGQGGVIGLIYLSGYLIKEGTTFYEFLNSQQAENSDVWHSVSSDYSTVPPPPAQIYLYPSMSHQESLAWSRELRPHALHTLGSIVPYAAWSHAEWKPKCAFIITAQDRVHPHSAQLSMAVLADIEQKITLQTG